MAEMTDSVAALLRLPLGPVDLTAIDPRSTPGFTAGKAAGKRALADLGPTLGEVQERLYAESKASGTRRVLVVLQGMDTSGKGGVLRHSLAALDPQGIQLASFKAPTDAERRHDFLWRIEQHLPTVGMIGVFDRSHYEDVLIARVRSLVKAAEIERRYGAINDFEKALVDDDVTVIKCVLHISKQEQKSRLRARLDNPDKHWKFNPGDIDERAKWDSYQQAYERALERCNTSAAPWYVVPSDRKWYRNWAIAKLLLEHLQLLAPQWPVADFDVAQQRVRLAGS